MWVLRRLMFMKANNTCPKCECKEILRGIKALDRNDSLNTDLSVATFKHPEALVFRGQLTSTLSAYVCSRCGYVEFYADDVEILKEAPF